MIEVNDSQTNTKERVIILALILVALAVSTVAIVPSLRHRVKSLISSPHRQILAKVSGVLGEGLPHITALKIESDQGLSLEVYESDQESGNLKLVSKFDLGEKREAFFSFQGNASNLALTDVDNDGILEIVCPTYDDQMLARLIVVKYNKTAKTYDIIGGSY